MSDDEYLELLSELSVPEDYEPVDRYNDFRAVFLETEQGRRVLKQILSWGHLLSQPPIVHPVDPYSMMISVGERNLSLRLFSVMLVHPERRRSRQKTTHEEED